MPASSGEVIGAALQSVYGHINPSHHQNKQHQSTFQENCIADQLLEDINFTSHGGKKTSFLSKNPMIHLNKGLVDKKQLESKMTGNKKEDQLEDPKCILWPRERVKLGWQNKNTYQGAGFDNLGNTCYMNSSLQALFHIPALLNWLLDEGNGHIQKCESNHSNSSYCSICAMIRTLRAALNRSTSSMKPSHIHNKLKCIGKTLMYGRQEDAHEFIKLLLDHMEKSYLSIKNATKLDHRSKETTPLNQIFGGYIRQQVICPLCRYVSTTFSHFQDLVLDIRSVNSVDDALNLHFRKETLDSDNAYKCEKCHKRVSATKQHLIERAPHVLLLQLKRFTIAGGKIGKHIHIQKTIDISRFVNSKSSSSSDANKHGIYQYKLASMVIHIGSSQHGGHYTAVAQASNQAMYEFDDSMVRTISMQSALLRNPYILFYEMIERPKEMTSMKPVIRQSSAKTLIRQNSTEGSSKPLPTSHSSSCVSNGFGKPTNDLGESAKQHRSPIKFSLNQKDRDKPVIVINKHVSASKITENKSNKITLHSSNNNILATKNQPTTSSPSTSGIKKIILEKKPSLVPYANDSDDSDHDDKKVITNGAISKSHDKTEKIVPKNRVEKINGVISLHNSSGKIINGVINHDPCSSKESNTKENNQKTQNSSPKESSTGKSATGNLNGKVSAPFMPRSVQIQSKNRPSSPSSSSTKSCDFGWIVTDANNVSAENKNDANIVHIKPDIKIKSNEKPDVHGWTITACKTRPEFEKSHSQDSVLPGVPKDDDTSSVRSKTSIDSNRSERSTKSMKKSLLSFIPCMSVAASPDPSPEEKPLNQEKSISERVVNGGTSKIIDDNEENLDDLQSKRFRDGDNEPPSPSKKCRPEDKLKHSQQNGDSSKNYSNKDSKSENNAPKTWPGGSKSKSSSESDKRKNFHIENDENFSMEEKKSRHKLQNPRGYNSDSDSCEESQYMNGTESKAKLNSNINIVEWDQNRTDVLKSLKSESVHMNGARNDQLGKYQSSIIWNSSKSTSVVDELRRSGNYGLGSKVATWDGSESLYDQEAVAHRRDAKKRTNDDLYNEEFDAARVKKSKKHCEITMPKGNLFQKLQDNRNNPNMSNGHSLNRSNTWNGSSSYYNGYQNSWNGHSNGTSTNGYHSSSNGYQSNGYKNRFSKSKSWDKSGNNTKYNSNRPKFNNYKHSGKDRFHYKRRSRD